MKKAIIAISIALIYFAIQHEATAQERAGSALENKVITAVEKYNDRKFAESAEILRQVTSSDPDNDAAHYYLGLSELYLNRMDAAESELKKAVMLDSTNFWYRYRLAMLYSISDRRELTIAMYEDLLKDFPKKNDLYYNLIDLYLAENRSDEALETLSQIETVSGKNEATAMTRFQLLGRMGREQEAYSSLEDFNREYSSPQVLSVLGDYQMSMYNDSAAVRYYDEALDIAPGYAPAILGKAEAFRITRKYDGYFSLIDRFLADDSIPSEGKCDYLKAIVQRADPMFIKTFMPRIDTMITRTMDTHPKDSSVLLTAGIYYYNTGRGDEAVKYLRENMDTYPESLSAAASYVEILMYMHDWDALSEESRAAFGRFPSEPAFLEMAGMADYNKGEYEKVLDNCRTILSVAAGDSTRVLNAYSTMGDMYHQLGENKKAYKAYDEALKVNQDYAPVLNNYAYYLSMEGKKLKKAAAMSGRTVVQEPDNPTYLDTFGWILYLQGRSEEAKAHFKHAMLYGGKDSAVILDHYAEVLYSLGEYDLAMVYWNQARTKNNGTVPDLDERISRRKSEMKRK